MRSTSILRVGISIAHAAIQNATWAKAIPCGAIAAFLVTAGGQAQGAMLTGTVAVSTYNGTVTPVNLTTEGTLDWRQFSAGEVRQKQQSPDVAVNIISNSDATQFYVTGPFQPSWTDGTSIAPGNTRDLHANVGDGPVSFTLNAPSTDEYVLKVYVGAYNGVGGALSPAFKVTLPGATDYTNSSIVATTGVDGTGVYTINFKADTIGDLLTVSLTDSVQNESSTPYWQAATLSAVPEPATLSLLGLGAIGLLTRRRMA